MAAAPSITLDRILAAAPTTTRGQPTQLSVDSKGQRIAYPVSEALELPAVSLLNPFVNLSYQNLVREIYLRPLHRQPLRL